MTPLTIALATVAALGLALVARDIRRYRRAGRDWRPDVRRDRDGGGL